MFLSKPELFSNSLERYKYQDYSFSFREVSTNKNPLYPELIFEDVVLKNKNGDIKIIKLKMGLNMLGYFFDDLKRLKYLKIYATQIKTENYISLLPESSITLKNNLLNIIDSGNIEELYFEFIDEADISINNELIISDVILNLGSERKLSANRAFITADPQEVKIKLGKGSYEDLPFEEIMGFLNVDTMGLSYISVHKSINDYAENILPLGVLNFKNDIQLFTSGFADLRNNKNKNFGFISFQDLSDIKYLEDGFNIKTNIFIEDFNNVFSQNFISFNDLEINLYLSGNEIQNSSAFNFFSDKQSGVELSGNFNEGNLRLDFESENLKGSIVRDASSFFRINLYDSNINFNLRDSENDNFVLPNLKFRVTGENVIFNDAIFNSIDFYYLKNGDVLTLNDINIDSDFLKISNYENEPAYFSINASEDFYKIKGLYEFYDIKNSLKLENFPPINYLRSNINIQWNNLLELRNIEGNLDFLAKDFQVNQRNPNSALLNLIGLLDIQSFFDGYDGSSTDEYIKFKRGSGSMIFSQKYGRVVDDFSFEADFGNMDWSGFIIKDNSGFFEELDLELSLKLNLQENIPWYAAIFGGLGVAAGTAIIGSVFEDQIEDISTIEYSVKGPLNSPSLERLE
ncbi:MAG: AsmA-like C-terminal region-containing protein [Gammaproteobacteria bacterium]